LNTRVSCPIQTVAASDERLYCSTCQQSAVFDLYCRCTTVRSASSIIKHSAGHLLGIPNMRQESTAVFWGGGTRFSKCTFSGLESFMASVDCDVGHTANGCADWLL
jgi:hypothetical protein